VVNDEIDAVQQRERVLQTLVAFASAQSELGRLFARSRQMHTTDAAAIVEILAAEGRGQPLTPARLAERIALTTGATSTLLNRLEEAGHIVRTREHRDRRVVTLHSTQTIHQTADAYYAPLSDQLHAAMAECSPADLTLVEDFVDRLRTVMSSYMHHVGSPSAQTETH
jgi:MarR family transcriptional regulator, organic hydroperoxide resistance regulator